MRGADIVAQGVHGMNISRADGEERRLIKFLWKQSIRDAFFVLTSAY